MKKDKKFYVICSLAIGDGCIRIQPRSTKKTNLSIAHHIKHQDYIEYKQKILEKIGVKTHVAIKKHKPNMQYAVTTNNNYLCYCVRKKLYEDKQKVFTQGMMKNFDAWSLAILYMDDGHMTFMKKKNKDGIVYKYKAGGLATNSFDKINNEKVLKWLEKKFGIIGFLRKDNRLSEKNKYSIGFGAENINKLISVVKPIVKQIPSMKYKIRD